MRKIADLEVDAYKNEEDAGEEGEGERKGRGGDEFEEEEDPGSSKWSAKLRKGDARGEKKSGGLSEAHPRYRPAGEGDKWDGGVLDEGLADLGAEAKDQVADAYGMMRCNGG